MRKKLCFVILTAITIFLLYPAIGYADSPITSTEFYVSYLDVDIVEKASEMDYIDEEIARYLSDPENPLDIKAAVINAIGWRFEEKDNAERYSGFIFGKPLGELDFDTVPAHDLFCIGYLMAMDNYFEPERAIPLLEKACEAFPGSFTAAMINALVKAQAAMIIENKWETIWALADNVVRNKNLEMDMRPEAVDIIMDYMILFKSYAPELNVNGKTVETDTEPYVFIDVEMLLPVRFVIEGLGGGVAWNGKNKIVTCMLNDTVIILKINSKDVLVDYECKTLDAEITTINNRTYVPASFIREALGVDVQLNENTRVVNVIGNYGIGN
ncbi:MAG TPA: hypothetical protein GXX14_13575 [Clostridiaceae bacterium]|nr:hypothetical protein [Clostridiaceae bacterium]